MSDRNVLIGIAAVCAALYFIGVKIGVILGGLFFLFVIILIADAR